MQPTAHRGRRPCARDLLVCCCNPGAPGWAGSQQLSASLLRVLAALLEPSECESADTKQARRQQALAAGAVQALACQVLGPCCSNMQLLLPAAACLRFLALAPGAAKIFASECVGGHVLCSAAAATPVCC